MNLHLDDVWEVGVWLVVLKEGTFQGLAIEEVHQVGIECHLLVWDTHQPNHALPLHSDFMTQFKAENTSTLRMLKLQVYREHTS